MTRHFESGPDPMSFGEFILTALALAVLCAVAWVMIAPVLS